MAKVDYGPLVTQVSGRFGGMVFSRWKGIQTIRRFVAPSDPNTNDQIIVRNRFRNAAYLYQHFPRLPAGTSPNIIPDIFRHSWGDKVRGTAQVPVNALIALFGEQADGTLLADIDVMASDPTLPAATITGSATGAAGSLSATPAAYTAPTGHTLLGYAVVATPTEAGSGDALNLEEEKADVKFFGLGAKLSATAAATTVSGLVATKYKAQVYAVMQESAKLGDQWPLVISPPARSGEVTVT